MVLSSIPSGETAQEGRQDLLMRSPAPELLKGAEWSSLTLPKTPLFGTDGIRGRVGDILNASLALQVGYWAGKALQQTEACKGSVVLGQDSRNSSEMLAIALTTGLNAAGLDVWDLGLCPTPAVASLTQSQGAIGGVMISASHNPPEDNGIKFFDGTGAKLSTEQQRWIEAALRGGMSVSADPGLTVAGQHFQRSELLAQYVEAVCLPFQAGQSLDGLRVVLDLAWGAATLLAPKVFERMGATVICLHNQPDGDRINVNCGSTHPASLQAAVREQGADLGFAFDGDADRVIAVDSTGRIVDGDYILYFWGQALQQRNQLPDNLIITTVMANLGFERAWERQGGRLLRTAVGDQYVQAEMNRTGAMLGGEQSGHILCPRYSISGDGILTALHLSSIVKQSGQSLAKLVEESFQTYPQLLRNVRVEDRDRRLNWKQSEMLQRAIAQAEADLGDRGRILVRASGTEPVIRVMVEASATELAEHWTETLVAAVQQYAQEEIGVER